MEGSRILFWKFNINWFLYYLIVGILLFSGISKVLDIAPIMNALGQISFFSKSMKYVIAYSSPALEITLAVLLIQKSELKILLSIVIIVFALFLSFSIYGTLTGLETDCGCFGPATKVFISILMQPQ